MKEDELRTKLNEVLKKQEQDSKKVRRDTNSWGGTIWSRILPKNYSEIIRELSKEGLLVELQNSLGLETKIEIWSQISDFNLAQILDENFPKNHEKIFSEMSYDRMESFVNSPHCDFKIFFSITDISIEVELLKMLSLSNLKYAIATRCNLLICKWLERICTEAIDEEDKTEIFKKIAQLPAKTIAELLEDTKHIAVIDSILREMDGESISATCGEIQPHKLLDVLEKCNYSILKACSDFPVWNLQDEQRQTIFSIFRQKETRIRDIFSVESIINEIYPAVSLADKEYILYDVLTQSDLSTLYESLPEAKQKEMLLIMLGQKTANQYEDAIKEMMREKAIYVLEKKWSDSDSGLDYYEALVLKDLKS